MKTIAFIGDPHTFHLIPQSRRDDYSEIILKKIRSLKKHVDADAYILLGDVFHRPVLPIHYLTKVAEALLSLDKPVYTVVGNHDVVRYDMDRLDEASLGLFIKVGILRHLTEVKFKVGEKRYVIHGTELGAKLPKAYDKATNICVAHAFYEHASTPTDHFIFKDADVKEAGHQYYVLGHDHVKYETFVNDKGQHILRPGSFSRGTAHNYNLQREISVVVIECTRKGLVYRYKNIPTEPAQAAFKRKAFEPKRKSGKDMVFFIRGMLSTTIATDSVFDALDDVIIEDDRIREYLTNLLLQYGFTKSKEN